MVPSSAYANAPKKESTPEIIQAARMEARDGRFLAIRVRRRKMPDPITMPTTIAVVSRIPSLRGKSCMLPVVDSTFSYSGAPCRILHPPECLGYAILIHFGSPRDRL